MSETTTSDKHISRIEVSGLRGRMLDLPAPEGYHQRSILLIYGHRATLERNLGLALDVNRYGRVVMPDLPGFGGMDSFYKLAKQPTIDNYADYLAEFIKRYYNQPHLVVVGFSFGFLVVTRLLQRHPDLVKRVELLISIAGFVDRRGFKLPKLLVASYRLGIFGLKNRLGSWLFRYLILQGWVLRLFYDKTYSAKAKFKGMSPARRRRMLEVEVQLWHCNDVRTWAYTAGLMLTANFSQPKIPLKLWQVMPSSDQYFDTRRNRHWLKQTYAKLTWLEVELDNHAPTVIATAKEAAKLTPPALRRILVKPPKRDEA